MKPFFATNFIVGITFTLLFIQSSFAADTKSDSLLEELQHVTDQVDVVDIHLALASEYQQSDLLESVKYAREGLIFSQELETPDLQYELLIVLGWNYMTMGFYDLALENLIAAKEIARENKWLGRESIAINNIGNIYWYIEDYQKALPFYQQYSQLSKSRGDTVAHAIGTMNAGICFIKLNQFDSAITFLEKALSMAYEFEDGYAIGLSYLNLGWYYENTGNFARALQYYTSLENNYLDDLAISYKVDLYNSITKVFTQLNQFDKAELYAEKAKITAEQSNSDYLKMLFYEVRHTLDSTRGERQLALQNKNKFLQLSLQLEKEKSKKSQTSFNLLFDLQQKQSELLELESANEIQGLKIKNDKILITVGTLVVILLLIVIAVVIYAYRAKLKSSNIIGDKNTMLRKQTMELEALNEEITSQREELFVKNKELVSQSEELKELNGTLQSLNDNLEHIVAERTNEVSAKNKELESKNSKLEEYAFLNAHKLRAPVATLLGLIQIFENDKVSAEEQNEIIDRIKESTEVLNEVVQHISTVLQEEGYDTKINE